MILSNTKLVATVAGTQGVAIYQGALRFWNLTLLPIFGFASALTVIVAAAWGANKKQKINQTYYFAIKVCLVIQAILFAITYFGAPLIGAMYSWSRSDGVLTSGYAQFFQMFAFTGFATVLTALTEAMLIGVGMSNTSLLLSFYRCFFFVIPLTLIAEACLKTGLYGI